MEWFACSHATSVWKAKAQSHGVHPTLHSMGVYLIVFTNYATESLTIHTSAVLLKASELPIQKHCSCTYCNMFIERLLYYMSVFFMYML